MTHIAAIAERWARLWGSEPRRAVEEVYSADAVHEDLTDPTARLEGHAARLEVEERLHRRLPDRSVEVLRLLELDGTEAVLECLVRGTSSTDPGRMATPALLWWWLDADGRVGRELSWFRWRDRRPDDGRVAGALARPRPPGPPLPDAEADDDARSQAWYRAYAAQLADTWSWDPVLADRSLYDEACVVESALSPGRALRGREAIEAADRALARAIPRPHRRLCALDVLGEGRAVAIRVALEGRDQGRGPLRRAYGALVLTLDSSDRVVSNRTYLDWSSATAEDETLGA